MSRIKEWLWPALVAAVFLANVIIWFFNIGYLQMRSFRRLVEAKGAAVGKMSPVDMTGFSGHYWRFNASSEQLSQMVSRLNMTHLQETEGQYRFAYDVMFKHSGRCGCIASNDAEKERVEIYCLLGPSPELVLDGKHVLRDIVLFYNPAKAKGCVNLE